MLTAFFVRRARHLLIALVLVALSLVAPAFAADTVNVYSARKEA